MRSTLMLITGLLISSTVLPAMASEIPTNVTAAVENPNRSEENSARDADRKPAEVLGFFGVKPGMSVIDWGAGGGYFTEILANAVGPGGTVYAQYSAGERFNQMRPGLEAKYAPFGNIKISTAEEGANLPYPDNSVDMVLMSLIIHHFHYSEDSAEKIPPSSATAYADILRILKPGGQFAIIEHRAIDGSSREESASWHRIPESVLVSDVSGAGFTLDGKNDSIHYNPDDAMNTAWFGVTENEDGTTARFDNGLRGKTTRLVYLFRKPN